jgi:hypothetical protein
MTIDMRLWRLASARVGSPKARIYRELYLRGSVGGSVDQLVGLTGLPEFGVRELLAKLAREGSVLKLESPEGWVASEFVPCIAAVGVKS